jgi:O-antigen/teichoic acid export membrane protein
MIVIQFFMHHDAFTNLLIVIIALSELFKVFEVINYFFQAQVLSKYVVQVQVAINFIVSLLKILLVLLHASLIWFALVVALGAILNGLGYWYAYHKREGTLRKWVFKQALAYHLLRESWPLVLYGVALNIQARVDQVMLGKMLNNYEVGQYSVALKFIEIFGFMPVVLMNTFSPAVTRAKAVGQELYHNRLINLYRLMFLAFLAIAVPIYFLSERIIVWMYGAEYSAAGYLLSLFALRLFFSNMGVGKSAFVVNESLFKYSLSTVVIGALVNISLNYLLIPKYASVGSVIASLASFAVSIFLIDIFFQKTRENQLLMFKGIFTFWKLKEIL